MPAATRESGVVRVAAWAGGVLVALFCALALVVAVPPSLANLASEAADGATAYPLASDAGSASVLVPEGWVVVRAGDAAITVRTPDGALSAEVELTADAPATVIGDSQDPASPVRREVLASELTVTHVDQADGAVLAVVQTPEGVVRVHAAVESAATPEEAAAYRPSIGELLEAIR